MSDFELPDSGILNVLALSQIFEATTTSYKYLFFLSILDLLKKEQFKASLSLSFESIFVEMLVNAWYPHSQFRLSFGKKDQIPNSLDALRIKMLQPILKFTDLEKSSVRQAIQKKDLNAITADLKRNVPFRLIRPFLIEKLRRFDVDYQVVQETPRIADQYFDIYKPLYCFNATTFKESDAILLHPDWLRYLQENHEIVRHWAAWEWLDYMQQRNPTVHNLIDKLLIA